MSRPVVSLLMPILNEERNLPRCLQALSDQDYPKESLELIIADGGSVDRSLEVVSSYDEELQITVLDNSERREPEWGKALAFRAATGSYIQCVDADMWPSGPNLISKLVAVMEQTTDITGVVARYHSSPELSVWSRYLSHDEFQRDALFQVLTPDMDRFVTEHQGDFDICSFPSPRVPPMGQTTMFRRKDVDLRRWNGSYNDIDLVAAFVAQGKNRFAYIRDVGWCHEHCDSLSHLLTKRRRNMLGQSSSYLLSGSQRDFVWLDTSRPKEVVRVIAFALAANAILPEAGRGAWEAFRHRRVECLLRPVVSMAVVDTLLLALLESSDGRLWIRQCLGRLARSLLGKVRFTDHCGAELDEAVNEDAR